MNIINMLTLLGKVKIFPLLTFFSIKIFLPINVLVSPKGSEFLFFVR